MDYEKKYKQLHTLISDLYPFMSEYCKEKVEGFFPELKESEDEKIRKELISFLQSYDTLLTQKFIAWLEKQEELVNSLSKGLDNAHERIDELIQKNNKLCIKLEKQGKHSIYNVPSREILTIWDLEMLEKIDTDLYLYEGKVRYGRDKEGADTIKKHREWFKIFKDKVHPQSQWKPSEEQMEALDDFIYAKYPNIEKHGAVVKSLYQDLKKLREE